MKRIFLLTSFIGCMQLIYGQTPTPDKKLSSMKKIDLGLQGIGFTFELGLGNSVTTDLSLGFGGGYNISEGSIDFQVVKPALYFSATSKYFYNLKKRVNKGKTVQNNSGNYMGLRLKYIVPLSKKADIIRNSILTNIHWGATKTSWKQLVVFNSHWHWLCTRHRLWLWDNLPSS